MRIDVIFTRLNYLFRIGNPGVSPDELFNGSNLSDENIAFRDALLLEGWDQTNVIFRSKELGRMNNIRKLYI